jgi:hypothetical protein
MKNVWPKIALLVLCCGAIGFELWHFGSSPRPTPQNSGPAVPRRKPDFVLLPVSETATYADIFGSSKLRVESWEPTLGDINDLERNLPQISTLSAEFHDSNRHIDDAREYFRQYLPVTIKGTNLVFVNAFCHIDPEVSKEWRKHLMIGNDGGKCFWHATYNPSTHTFSDLIVNGLA